MATIKHIKSRNTNYSDAIDYLLFQHNEGTMKPIIDDMGRKLLREEFFMDIFFLLYHINPNDILHIFPHLFFHF